MLAAFFLVPALAHLARAQSTDAVCGSQYDWVSFLCVESVHTVCQTDRRSFQDGKLSRTEPLLNGIVPVLSVLWKRYVCFLFMFGSHASTSPSRRRLPDSNIDALQAGYVYTGATSAATGTDCVCSTVTFAVLAACAVCQGRGLAIDPCVSLPHHPALPPSQRPVCQMAKV